MSLQRVTAGAGMNLDETKMSSPIAIGGVGGSGTRVVARLVQALGFYVGDDLNEACDNLWFTLLFKRRGALIESAERTAALIRLFTRRMTGSNILSDDERSDLLALAADDRPQHDRVWLQERVNSFVNSPSRPPGPWGWKEPNTHVLVDHFLRENKDLRYVHVFRDPLDMSISSNQNQLRFWGPLLLGTDVVCDPRTSLRFWCVADRRIRLLMQRWPERVHLLNFDGLCKQPGLYLDQLQIFLRREFSAAERQAFANTLAPAATIGRSAGLDPMQFDPADLAYVTRLGLGSYLERAQVQL